MQKWQTFGYDMARVNADIRRQTGKWGKLKTPDEVHEYLQTMAERPIPTTEAPKDRAVAKPPKPRKHSLAAGRVVSISNGNATLYKANEYGIPMEVLEVRPTDSKAEGRAFMCDDCKGRFTSWDDFLKHALEEKEKAAKSMQKS